MDKNNEKDIEPVNDSESVDGNKPVDAKEAVYDIKADNHLYTGLTTPSPTSEPIDPLYTTRFPSYLPVDPVDSESVYGNKPDFAKEAVHDIEADNPLYTGLTAPSPTSEPVDPLYTTRSPSYLPVDPVDSESVYGSKPDDAKEAVHDIEAVNPLYTGLTAPSPTSEPIDPLYTTSSPSYLPVDPVFTRLTSPNPPTSLLSWSGPPYSGDIIPSDLSWSPDGCILAVSATDAYIRLYNPQGENHVKKIKESEHIYSFSWTTLTSHLVATGRYQPIHLWDTANTPTLVATYKCINQLDELSHAFSVATGKDNRLYAGLKGEVRVFDISRPGRECDTHMTSPGQGGILSCLDISPVLPVYAVGCYNRTTGLYTCDQGSLLCLLTGQVGGVTQVTFSQDGTKLYTGGRKDPEILCWDLREPGKLLASLHREVTTNQRIQFSCSPCGRFLASGNTDGSVRIWDIVKGQVDSGTKMLEPLQGWLLPEDAVSGVDWHSDGRRLATCSGQRHFPFKDLLDDGEEEEELLKESSVRIWTL